MASPTYTSVISVGLLGSVSNILATPDTFYRCSVCAALTDVQATHTAWHAAQDAAAAAVNTSIQNMILANALQDIQIQKGVDASGTIAANTTCPVCSGRLPMILLLSHLNWHRSRARNDQGEMPTSAQMQAARDLQA